MNCIFCNDIADASTIEHILPESLGGKKWAALPLGLVCRSCNQYFGSKVESLALASFPFLPFRLLLAIPTKHEKPPKMQTHLGTVKSSFFPGKIGIDPISHKVEEAILLGKITQLRILAEPTEPLAICRLLLKMGLEVVASDSPEDVYNSKFDLARQFARAPSRNAQWWFLLYVNHGKLFEKFLHGISQKEWLEGVLLEIMEVEGAEVFHLKLLDMDFITPLERDILQPPMNDLPESEYRLFNVSC